MRPERSAPSLERSAAQRLRLDPTTPESRQGPSTSTLTPQLGALLSLDQPGPGGKHKCKMCLDNLPEEDRKFHGDRISKVKTFCSGCGKTTCKDHGKFICLDCIKKSIPVQQEAGEEENMDTD